MIRGFTVLLACQLAGEIVARFLGLPVPGPVIGLAILVALLHLAGRLGWPRSPTDGDIGRVSDALLGGLAFLFVPAGVGVVQHVDTVGPYATALGLTLVCSTVLTLAVTVAVFLLVKRLFRSDRKAGA